MKEIKLESLGDILRYMEKSKIDLCLDIFDLTNEIYRLRHEIEALTGKINNFIEYQEECDSYHSQ